jgi:hypothetical protein
VPGSQHPETTTERPRSITHRRRLLVLGGVAVLVLVLLNGAYQATQAVRAGTRGKGALIRAEDQLNARQPRQARQSLTEAHSAFRQVRRDLLSTGPLLPLARVIPFVRIQTRGVEAFASAGEALSSAGLGLTDSASALLEPSDGHVPVSSAVDSLRSVHTSLQAAVKALDQATARVAALNGYRLVGPIGTARDDLASRLPRIGARAASAEQGLGALLAFAGDSGPRRYLFVSQNPDEVRPTGGFIGTYGILVAEDHQLRLDRFEGIDDWIVGHPDAVVPPAQAPSALRFSSPPARQTLANANAVPDWPQAAAVAAQLWAKGGEAPVDGVLSVTPGFLAKVLAVLGPVQVPAYGETVDANNVRERFDFYTRQNEAQAVTDKVRKAFVAELAQAVMSQLLAAPASQWDGVARAIGQAFDSRLAMAWSTDEQVATALADRGWDGALPVTQGDFFYGAEFQFETKSGGGLRRTYDHQVDLHADGSATVTTTVTIRNPQPRSPFNNTSVIYFTAYGPQGATLDPASDKVVAMEAPIGGHPAAGWFRGAGPLSQATVKVVWDVPNLARQIGPGAWELPLHFMGVPDHTGDNLNLTVNLPEGWSWKGPAPPPSVSLDADIVASWTAGPS